MTRAQELRKEAYRLLHEADELETDLDLAAELNADLDGDFEGAAIEEGYPEALGRVVFADFCEQRIFLNGYEDGSVLFGAADDDTAESFVLTAAQAEGFAGLLLNWSRARRFSP